MEPRVTKANRKIHLLYPVQHRIHCCAIYPVPTPNGARVFVYGHEHGLRILWRGGARSHVSEDYGTVAAQHADDDEEEEDDLDPDCPYPRLSRAVDVELDAAVLHLAVPLLEASTLPKSQAIITVALADGSQRVLSVPLAAPNESVEHDFKEFVRNSQVSLHKGRSPCRAIAVKIVAPLDAVGEAACSLLVAGASSDTLSISRLSCRGTRFELSESQLELESFHSPLPLTSASFTPSPMSALLLVVNASDTCQLFDARPKAAHLEHKRPSSSGSAPQQPLTSEGLGPWLMALQTSFIYPESALARRKHILDAKWLVGGKAIIVLLEDGEWGIWDVAGTDRSRESTVAFALRGVLGSSSVRESTEPSTAQKIVSKLAPMTPNTRKAKAETLFVGAPKIPGVQPRGGISVCRNNARIGRGDESVIMWYGGEVYSIPSSQAFWQRSTAPSGRGAGSLHSSTLTHITGVNLKSEAITSISQLATAASSNNLGQMHTQRDLLISAEHHITILQISRPSAPAKAFAEETAGERPMMRDQKLLHAGDLDLGGMDRLLDEMTTNDARPRRVGFAH